MKRIETACAEQVELREQLQILYRRFLFVVFPVSVMCILNPNLPCSQSAQRCKNPLPIDKQGT